MFKLILSSLLLFASPCFAKVLMACSLQGADVSSVEIKEEGGRLIMTEILVESRKPVVREVSAQEWAGKVITLSVTSKGAKSTLTYDKSENDWWLDHTDGGFNNHGYMRCN